MRDAYFLYVAKFQTLEDLGKKYKKNPRTIRNYFDTFDFVTGEKTVHKPIIIPVMDATFFERGYGVLLCRADEKNIHWKHIATEKVEHYACCLHDMEIIGFRFAGFVIDGRRGVLHLLQKLYLGVPVQFCQFHQIMIVKRYIPARAKTEAARMLRSIALRLSNSHKVQFETALDIWYVLFGNFMNEKTYSTGTKRKWRYTHRRLRSAYFSMRRNLPWLFTFQEYPERNMPNTTNTCDGFFSHLKEKIGRHRGLSRERRQKMLDYILESL
jgi:hypothetical protein